MYIYKERLYIRCLCILLKSPTASMVIPLTQGNKRLIKNENVQIDWTKIIIF